jgi:DNA-binding NtrC family response regulator
MFHKQFHNVPMKKINETFFKSSQPITRSEGEALARMVSFLIPDAAVFTVDKDKRISFWSAGAEKLLGFTSNELNGEVCISGNRCPQCMKGCGLMQLGKVEGLPLILHASNGDSRPVIKYAIAYTREDGEFDGGLEVLIPQKVTANFQHLNLEGFDKYGLISQSPEMEKVFEIVRRVSQTDIPVLIRGESGTGKELVARAIHGESLRRNAPFIAINCATLNAGLLESELFGHVKGAFTGAIKDHHGMFERAKGGTLFLDEVAELPLDLQAKLLRVLESGEFSPVGSERTIVADVRIVTATHRALREEVKNGRFRQDLLYRLRVVPIFLPSLLQRKSDIPLLINHILDQQFTNQTIPEVSKKTIQCMMDYDWPGNVRELKNAIHYALVMFDGETIQPSDLPQEITQSLQSNTYDISRRSRGKLSSELILSEIKSSHGNQTLAAKKLGIGRTTLWRLIKNMNMEK